MEKYNGLPHRAEHKCMRSFLRESSRVQRSLHCNDTSLSSWLQGAQNLPRSGILHASAPTAQTLPQLQEFNAVTDVTTAQTLPQLQEFNAVTDVTTAQTLLQLQQFNAVTDVMSAQTLPRLEDFNAASDV